MVPHVPDLVQPLRALQFTMERTSCPQTIRIPKMAMLGKQQIPWQGGVNITAVLAQSKYGHRDAVVKLDGKLISARISTTRRFPRGPE